MQGFVFLKTRKSENPTRKEPPRSTRTGTGTM